MSDQPSSTNQGQIEPAERSGTDKKTEEHWISTPGGRTTVKFVMPAIALILGVAPFLESLLNIRDRGERKQVVNQGDTKPKPEHGEGAPPKPKPFTFEDYIDSNARPVVGRKNIAIHVLTTRAFDTVPLAGAAQRGLKNGGYNVLPLFRKRFADDGLDRELFGGSASLASKLELSKHCDRILLGAFRIVGTPKKFQGLFIAEAAFSVKEISPESGAVMDEIEIREKGGGASGEASIADAADKLTSAIESRLVAWPKR